MCGPLALALPAAANTRTGFFTGRVMYNLGRIATYCLLGIVFGLVGQTLAFAGVQRWVSIFLGFALLFGLASSRKLALWRPVTSLLARIKFGMSGLLRNRSLFSLAILGILNGLLPCGLVYVACAGAVATGSLLSGALYMAVFGIGTIPMMLGIGLFGRLVPLSLRLHFQKAVPASVCLLAGLLIMRGLSLGIPYLSPDLSKGAVCCHK
jgi:sulfite exporter TauE/SafE